jgi:hypothetical protein
MHTSVGYHPSCIPDSRSARQKNRSKVTQKIHYLIHQSQPFEPVLSQLNSAHNSRYYYFKLRFNIIIPPTPVMSQAVSSIRALGSKPYINFSFLPRVLHVRTILTPRFIRHNDMWKSSNYDAPQCVIFLSLMKRLVSFKDQIFSSTAHCHAPFF